MEESKLKQIPTTGSFEANGHKYTIASELSIDRWIYQHKLELELGFGVQYDEVQREFKNILDLANKSKFADIVILAHNMVNGISKITHQGLPTILKFCALYMNRENEDVGTITEDMIAEKITDWKTEGYGIDGFFGFSLTKVRGLAENLQNHILNDSESQ